MLTVLGKQPIQLRFNSIVRLVFEKNPTRTQVLEFIQSLPKVDSDDDQETPMWYEELRLEEWPRRNESEQQILDALIPFEFRMRRYGKQGQMEVYSAYVFWLYPDIIVVNGARSVVRKAVEHLGRLMRKRGFEAKFSFPDFEWYYLLKLFEIVQNYREWDQNQKSGLGTRTPAPSTEIARGVTMSSLHDLNCEWEKDSSQAKKIITREAGDLTRDLSTTVAMLDGRLPKSILGYVTLQKRSTYVRITRGGRLFIKRYTPPSTAGPEPEPKRIVWALQLAQRLLEAYELWKSKPTDEMLPTPVVYERIEAEARRRIGPLMKTALKKRLRYLESIRRELRAERGK